MNEDKWEQVEDRLAANPEEYLVSDEEGLSLFFEHFFDQHPAIAEQAISDWLKTPSGAKWYEDKLGELYEDELAQGREHDE